ncbi:hypothetical protein J2X61_003681 [Bacillus sp. 3255]|nr:hypothetical protein [Bacillus sp. 3255]
MLITELHRILKYEIEVDSETISIGMFMTYVLRHSQSP